MTSPALLRWPPLATAAAERSSAGSSLISTCSSSSSPIRSTAVSPPWIWVKRSASWRSGSNRRWEKRMKVVRVPRPMAPVVTIQPPRASTAAIAASDTHSIRAEMAES